MKKDVVRLGVIAGVLIAVAVVGAALYRGKEAARQAEQAAKQPPPPSEELVRPHSRSFGPETAKVTVVEFFDPECETCRAVHPVIKPLIAQYGGKVRLVLRYMPFHGNSLVAASALEAAGEQRKYWEMLDVLFENQPVWGSHHAPRPELIPEYARQIGLDMTRFHAALNSTAHAKIVEIDKADGQKLGVVGTPTFFVNGKKLEHLAIEPLKAMIDEALAK
jgi:protein-disulfide isomerase